LSLRQRIKALEQVMGATTPHFVIVHPDDNAEEKIAAARALHGDHLVIIRINIVKPHTSQG
jgi:hypothetical protein